MFFFLICGYFFYFIVFIEVMKLNERSVVYYVLSDFLVDYVGFLRIWGGLGILFIFSGIGRRCWFVFKGNLLFFFESREGRVSLSLVVLEGCTVELVEVSVFEEFVFVIRFDVFGVRLYLFAVDGFAV